ncbi:hypothetical protein EDB83DRAFT_2315981 [Lactarius deliciosus]|nr:hypothetical protein EDB83DRAFT_2315981 [Lactarius deliciosus]
MQGFVLQRRVDGLVRGRLVWQWSGMAWVKVMGGMGLTGITMGWRFDVVPAWWWRCVVDGWGWAVTWVAMSERKKGKRKKYLMSHAGGVGGNVGQSKRKGLVGSKLVWWWAALQIVLRVLSWGGCHHGEFCGKAAVVVMWSVRNDTEKKKKTYLGVLGQARHRLVYRDSTALGQSFCAVGYWWWRLMETVRNNTKKKKPLPISLSSAVVLGGFAQQGDDSGELEATAGLWADVW